MADQKKEIIDQEFKVVLENLKIKGLDIAESALLIIWQEINAGLVRYVKATENQFDDLYLVIGPQIDHLIKNQIDKIDGVKDIN